MSVPSFGGIRLIADEHGPLLCGAAFNLDRASRGDGAVTVEGLSFEVRRGGRILVARGGPGATYEAARDSALLHAQKALDLFSISGVDADFTGFGHPVSREMATLFRLSSGDRRNT